MNRSTVLLSLAVSAGAVVLLVAVFTGRSTESTGISAELSSLRSELGATRNAVAALEEKFDRVDRLRAKILRIGRIPDARRNIGESLDRAQRFMELRQPFRDGLPFAFENRVVAIRTM